MATLVSALSTEFTPAVGDVLLQVTGGAAQLERKNTSGTATWAPVRDGRIHSEAVVLSNLISGAVYRFVPIGIGTPVVQADQ